MICLANTRLTKVSISGVTVSDNTASGSSGSLIKWEFKRDFGKPISTAKLTFTKNLEDVVPLKVGQELIISGGFSSNTDETFFRGEVQTFEPEAGKIVVKGVDRLYSAVRNTVNAFIYDKDQPGNPINPSGKISDAFQDIITRFTGLNADSGTVQDSGTATTLTI